MMLPGLVGMAGFTNASGGAPTFSFVGYHEWDTPPAGTHTISGASLGTPAANRYIVLSVARYSTTVPVVTIGGVSATLAASNNDNPADARLFIAAVPSGATGDIVITNGRPATYESGAAGVWALYGLSSATPEATAVTSDRTASAKTLTLTGITGGAIIITAVSSYFSAAQSHTFGGDETQTEQFDDRYDGTYHFMHAAADATASATGDNDVTITPTSSAIRFSGVSAAFY